MKVLELFAGTRSIGKAFERRGHEVYSVDWDKRFIDINLYTDIGALTAEEIITRFGKPDVIWASPDCTSYSVAALSKHRNVKTGKYEPLSNYAIFCDCVNKHVVDLIFSLDPAFWFIENPRGAMRHMSWMANLPRYTVTYCQYGDIRQKPTDIWTNHPNPRFLPPCKRGAKCHKPDATQNLSGSKNRARIPDALCEHIVDICEKP